MRIALFTDYDNTATLVEATLAEVDRRPGIDVVAIFTSERALARRRSRIRSLRRMVGAAVRGRPRGRSGRVAELGRRFQVPLEVVPARDPNDPAFLADLRARYRPDVALSYWSMTIFKEPWLAEFDVAVNFHDGRLPAHRGVGATMMEVYEGRDEGGFTFHHIDRGIDSGNILADGSVPIAGLDMMAIVEAKLVAAGALVGDVLDGIERRDRGRPQASGGSYTSAVRMGELSRIDAPGSVDRTEAERRIRAMASVSIPIRGRPQPVTRVSRRRGIGRPRVDFADASAWVSRIDGLHPAAFRAGQQLRRLFGR